MLGKGEGGGGGGGGGGLVWVTHQARGSYANCAVLIFQTNKRFIQFCTIDNVIELMSSCFWFSVLSPT